MKLLRMTLASAILAASTTNAYAAFEFTNISLTANSLTFTINGDMSGYASISDYKNQFGISYSGNYFDFNGTSTRHNWSTSVFDAVSTSRTGKTGYFFTQGSRYSWVEYTSDLSGAKASSNTVKLTYGDNYMRGTGTGTLSFLWGNPSPREENVALATFNVDGFSVSAVPEPSTITLMAGGLSLIGFMAARRRDKKS